MRALNDFQTYQEAFKTPLQLPTFFQENLVDPSRVVKVFEDDPQAHIRVFYYQYLKLCFEVNNSSSQALVQKIEEIINNPTFQFIFYQEDDPEVFNDNQAKRLISQFFGVLSSGQITVLDAINTYPIMDTIMVHFFRTLMILMDKAESLDNFIPRDELLSFLCSFFGIEVELHDACIKYVDTDVFVYDQHEKLVYMAYINYSEEGESQPTYQQEEEKQIEYNQANEYAPKIAVSGAAPPGQPSGRAPSSSIGGGKQSYIASEFYDYTQDNVTGGGLANKGTTLKGSGHFIASSEVQEATTKVEESKKVTSTFVQEDISKPKIRNDIIIEKSAPETAPNVTPKSYEIPFEVKPPTKTFQENNFHQQSTKITNQYTSQTNQLTNQYTSSQTNQYPSQQNQYAPPPQVSSTNQYTTPLNNQYTTPLNNQYTSTLNNQQTYSLNNQYTSTLNNQYTTSLNNQYTSPPGNKPTEPAVISPQKPTSVPAAKDIFYAPKESPLYNPKIQSQNLGIGAGNATTVVPGKKNVFGLNVSEQFTNSLTIKSMAEPYKTNVINIKTRARNFRTSLASYLK